MVDQITGAGGRASQSRRRARSGCGERDGRAGSRGFGRLDGLVNNAIGGRQEATGRSDPGRLRDGFDFGSRAVINTITAARPHMRQAGGGRVVNIVTELWNMAPADWSVYMAGKGAMVGLSRSLAMELGPENITVNMVAPGWMADEKVDTSADGSR